MVYGIMFINVEKFGKFHTYVNGLFFMECQKVLAYSVQLTTNLRSRKFLLTFFSSRKK